MLNKLILDFVLHIRYDNSCLFRGVAQFGRALRSGRRGRGFESRRLDYLAGATGNAVFIGVSGSFLRVSNEPCVDRMAGGCRELAHRQTHGRLDTYGECRDSHELRSSEVTCRHGALHHKAVCRHVSSALSPRAYWPSPLRTLILRFCRCFLSLWFHQMLF